ncbi:unnamed protein product [Lactuca saligna]|uniref:Uncharacterized protein n=1 Tax=Lactuca saligna TaxID=75948 RepID=A0AA36DW06_LACSI|nr:unnamed protein product [Lactuca saligna]
MSRRGRQVAYQLPPNCSSHMFLEFLGDLPNQSSFVFCLIAFLSKKIGIPQTLCWRVADESGLATRLELFLTHILRDDSGLEIFVYHGWRKIIGVREVVYKELCWELFSIVRFDKESRIRVDRSFFTFCMGNVSRFCNQIELGRHLWIFTSNETLCPNFYAYLDNCIIEPPQEYNYMQEKHHKPKLSDHHESQVEEEENEEIEEEAPKDEAEI